jgi:hypothetical protein
MSKVHALEQLGFEPQVDFRLYDNSDGKGQQMEWLSSDPQPSDAEIATAQTAYDAKAYARTRETAYPSIGDQLDMLWHAVDTGDWTPTKVKTTEFYTALKAVKDANPKP